MIATRHDGRRAGGIVMLVFGGLFALIALGLLAGGGFLMWADRSQRDSEGYLTSGSSRLASSSYAIAATDINLALSAPGWPVARDALGNVRITATGNQRGADVFVGIADRAEVQRYLSDAGWDQLTNFSVVPFSVTYSYHAGGAPGLPLTQAFWRAHANGSGTQTLTWKAESGQWAIVLMNADGSRGVSADVAIGATAPFLFGLALGLLIGGGVLLLIAVLMLVFGVVFVQSRRGATVTGYGSPAWTPAPPPVAAGASALSYPLRIEGHLDAAPSRWLWLVKWLLLIPHYIVLLFLVTAAFVFSVVAFFAILFTGRYPRSIFDFNVGVLRWWWRVSYYGYSALGTDQYPPFSFSAVGYPASLDVPYPERLSRGLVLVKWWLLAIPQYIVLEFIKRGLITVLVLIAAIAVLFTGRYPEGIFNLVMGLNRWVYRVYVYVLLMRDEYPPFRLDLGGSEQPPLTQQPFSTAPPPVSHPGMAGA